MSPCVTGPAPSKGVEIIAVAVVIVLALMRALLELLVCLLKLRNLSQKLCKSFANALAVFFL